MTTLAAKATGSEINANQVKVAHGKPVQFTEEAALNLVVQDASNTETWYAQRQWALRWRETDLLYQSPRSFSVWEGTTQTRSNVPRFTVAKHVNSIHPQMMSGIFYDSPPFVLRPRPGTSQKVVRAKTAVFASLLDEMEFQIEAGNGTFSQVNFGTGIWKWGWESSKKTRKKMVRKNQAPRVPMPITGKEKKIHTAQSDEFEVQEREITKERPWIEAKDLRHILVDRGWRKPDIRKAKFVIDRMYLTFRELEDLRGTAGYNIPPTEDLKQLFFAPKEQAKAPGGAEQSNIGNTTLSHAAPRYESTTADPTQQPLEVLERWDKDTVITVVQGKLVIRNEENEFGQVPFLSSNWWNIPDCGHGMGVGWIVGQDQRVEQGSISAALDILSLAVNQQYLRDRGANVPTQQIRSRLGGIIDVDVPAGKRLEDAFRILEPPKVPPEVWMAIQNAIANAESTSGANELLVQGSMPQKGRTSMGRTATGAGAMESASASRLQGPVGNFINQVFLPWLRIMDELINERMPMQQLREILSEELGEDFLEESGEEDFEADFLNAALKYEVLAGAHLAAKKAMAQALPLMVEIFENQTLLSQLHAMGWTVDVKELFNMILEMSEWKNTRDVIRPMTPDEKQAVAASNQGAIAAQSKMQLEDKKHANKSEEIDQTNEAALARDVIKDAITSSAERGAGEVLRRDFRMATG